MAHSQSYLCQPLTSSGVINERRPEEFGRSSGSAFAPYVGSATKNHPANLNSIPLRTEAGNTLFSSFMGASLDHPSSMTGSLGYRPYIGPLAAYPFGDASYRKNATRDATATLKAWLNEHRKNPYPTKGEKIMLAIITKMSLTQVSTWFANARRRLKKENKVTWTHRTSPSEDEDEDDHIDLEKHEDATYGSAFDSGEKIRKMCQIYNQQSRMEPRPCYSEPKEMEYRSQEDAEDVSTSSPPSAFTHNQPLETGGPSFAQPLCTRRGTPTIPVALSPPPVSKTKLWSLAEIAISPSVGRNARQTCAPGEESDCAVISTSARSPFKSSPCSQLLNSVRLSRHPCCPSSLYRSFPSSDSGFNGGPVHRWYHMLMD